ncbi:MAG TPA: MG2 domain-containing protein [Terracidiphilus sp.]|nr:MG2 domain-containing protein [Terracidiphilus sp.]
MDPRSSLRLLCSFVLLFFSITGFHHDGRSQTREFEALYRDGSLHLTIPYHSTRAGAGHLVVEILDPRGQSLGRIERHLWIGSGDSTWQATIAPAHRIATDDLVWQRVRYRFDYDDNGAPAIEDTQSISQILRRPVVRILAQTEYIAGSRAAVRVIVSDARNGAAEPGTVRIQLLDSRQDPRNLFFGNFDRRGTVEADFRFPASLAGSLQMRYLVSTPIGSTEYTQPVQIKAEASILLTTEKPIYQPGQIIHVRALALNRASHRAAAGRKLTFEIEDSRGNRVFRKSTQTDKFGIASAEFMLADEVNLGAYHLRALMGDLQAPADTAELTLDVERYVLPKFKVDVDFDKQNNKPRRDYRPGNHVTGTIHANYFFGKPVDHANVSVKISGMDVQVFEAASTSGKTDAGGDYRFDLKLPSYFAGRPLDQGATRAIVEATVTDAAAHAETRDEPITISASPLLVTAIPEGGALVPNVENEIFILTSYPDGTPARTKLTIRVPEARRNQDHAELRQISTDLSGVAVLRIDASPGIDSLHIEADDGHGSRVSSDVPLQTRAGADQILLHTDRAVVKAGEPIPLRVLSTRQHGTAYIDIVKDGQTILTRDVDLANGQAALTVVATPAMAGTLDVDAYLFGRDSQPVADHRLVFVQPADELKIAASTDSPVYLPGSEARIHFHVTDARGEGVEAALGLQVVDQAVFALAEKQPGFAKVFFYLEQELMKPRYEIHSLSMTAVVGADEPAGGGEARNLDARALFAATQMVSPHKVDVEFGRKFSQQRFVQYQEQYREAFTEQVRQIAAALSQRFAAQSAGDGILNEFARIADGAPPRDAWNMPLRIEPTGWNWGGNRYFRVVSAGSDRSFGTSDDMTVYVQEHSGVVVHQPGKSGVAELRIEHDHGPFDERAEATGVVSDATGAVIPGALVTLHSLVRQGLRSASSNGAGWFTFSGLPAGRYRIEASARGFQMLSRTFSVSARDRAVFSITLAVGQSTQTVTVQPVPMMRELGGFGGGMGAGAAPAGRPWNGPVNAMAQLEFAPRKQMAAKDGLMRNELIALKSAAAPAAAPAPHVRSYFPEALYINPEIVTDANGNADITIPMADSITTWRMTMMASTTSGALGTGDAGIKVFQDFFVDLDLPVTLTQGDRISIPVAIYNYSGRSGRVSVHLEPSDWYTLDDDAASKTVAVDSGRVGGTQFTVAAKRIGKFKLTVTARMEGAGAEARQDIVVREIEVVPNGREQDEVFNGRLETTAERDLKFSPAAIPGATSILVRLYPGPLSQVIEGMDSILRMPFGCFEQTSSATYPNVLALDYMKRTGKLTPEVHAKAEGYIATGYQRLLTFEVPGGGFSWFGQPPANKILTAYGLMEFNDMSLVSDVDPRLIERTRNWLIAHQQPDGSWKPDTYFINEGATNRFNTNLLRITAYIAWSLANTGYHGAAVEKARQYIDSYVGPQPDAYTLAVIANFAVDYGQDRDFTRRAMQALLDARNERGDQVSWTTQETSVYSTGESASVETTGLAAQALIKWGQDSDVVRKALNFIASKRDANGNWGTTQATIMALRALLLATHFSASDVRGTVNILLDGKTAATLQLTADNDDLFHQYVFKSIDAQKPASVQLRFAGAGSLAWQIVGRSFLPWSEKPAAEPLSIRIAYDRTHLAENDIATATATIQNRLPKFANMVMVDLGIPPGFDLLSEDLQSFEEKSAAAGSGRLEKFSLTATQAILYFNSLAPDQTITLRYRLRAKYPIRAHTFESRVYEYYDPQVSAGAPPVQLEVSAHSR